MINYIYGIVQEQTSNKITIINNNIGFEINVLSRDKYVLLSNCKLFVYEHFNQENEHIFYGFLDKNDLNLFKKLIKIQDIGCKTALNILNSVKSEELIRIIKCNDLVLLRSLIGVKANNVMLYLQKDITKMPDLFKYENVFEALKSLGYKKEQITRVLTKIETNLAEDEALKKALKLINYAQ